LGEFFRPVTDFTHSKESVAFIVGRWTVAAYVFYLNDLLDKNATLTNETILAVAMPGKKPKGLCITLVTNWLIKPFTMAALGIFFFEVVFADFIDPQSAKEYIAGMILLGVAPCTAMVFVWSQLVRGDANYTLAQVSINDIIMVFAFAPIAAFLLGITDVVVPWRTLVMSVLLYVLIPLVAGYLSRKILASANNAQPISDFTGAIKPFSIMGLLATVILLFGFQAQTIVANPRVIALIAVPLLIQSYVIFAFAYGWAYFWRVPWQLAFLG